MITNTKSKTLVKSEDDVQDYRGAYFKLEFCGKKRNCEIKIVRKGNRVKCFSSIVLEIGKVVNRQNINKLEPITTRKDSLTKVLKIEKGTYIIFAEIEDNQTKNTEINISYAHEDAETLKPFSFLNVSEKDITLFNNFQFSLKKSILDPEKEEPQLMEEQFGEKKEKNQEVSSSKQRNEIDVKEENEENFYFKIAKEFNPQYFSFGSQVQEQKIQPRSQRLQKSDKNNQSDVILRSVSRLSTSYHPRPESVSSGETSGDYNSLTDVQRQAHTVP